jgi:multidrug efflux pump subunit AcrA (membrane-fusion protein)
VLRAPFDGEVLARHAQVGAMASPGQPLLRLVDDAGREVEARVPEELAASLAEAGTLQFSAAGRAWPLAIARFGSAVDPASRARTLRLRFTAEAAPAGSSGLLRWTSPGFRLPAELLVEREGRLGVFLLVDGQARFTSLPGALPGRSAVLTLPAATRVVTRGQQSLQDGAAVADGGAP